MHSRKIIQIKLQLQIFVSHVIQQCSRLYEENVKTYSLFYWITITIRFYPTL